MPHSPLGQRLLKETCTAGLEADESTAASALFVGVEASPEEGLFDSVSAIAGIGGTSTVSGVLQAMVNHMNNMNAP